MQLTLFLVITDDYFIIQQKLACLLSCIRLFETLWTVPYQALWSKGFSRQRYWSGLPFLLHGTFLIQGLNPCHLSPQHYRRILYLLSHWGKPIKNFVLIQQLMDSYV